MNNKNVKKVSLNKLLEAPAMIEEFSTAELRSIVGALQSIDSNKNNEQVKSLLSSAEDLIKERTAKEYRTSQYIGSEVQTLVHDCANRIEIIRANIYRSKSKHTEQEFDKLKENLESLVSSFSGIAEKIRGGNIPCNCD